MEAWAGRETAAFRLPPSRLALDPADAIQLEHDGRLVDLRLVSIADAETRGIEAVRQDRAILSSAVLLTAPEAVSGAVLMSGRSPARFIEEPAAPERLAGKPVLIVHGLYAPILPVGEGRALRDTFAALPVELEYAEYPMGHTVSLESVERVNQWLDQRVNG